MNGLDEFTYQNLMSLEIEVNGGRHRHAGGHDPGLPQSFSQLSVPSPHPPKDITFKDVLVGFSLWHLLGAVFKRQFSS